MATTCNKNKQQQDGKSNVELYTKWTKTTWKAYDGTIRRGRYRSIKAEHVTVVVVFVVVYDDDDDDDDDDDKSSEMFTPYSFVNIYQHFEGSLCLHHCQEVQELPYGPSKRRSIFASHYGTLEHSASHYEGLRFRSIIYS